MNKLTYWRTKRGLTMRELAEQAEVGTATISRLEKGRIKSQWLTLGKLATALDIDTHELTELAEDNDPKQTGLPVGASL